MKNWDRVGELKLISLKNKRGTELKILNFGASIFSLTIDGVNVVVGPARPEDYISETYHKHGKFFGATVGRHAGRISPNSFEIEDQKFSLFGQDGVHLHGGQYGFSYKFWKVIEVNEKVDPFVELEYISPDGEEGYPGELKVRARYTLTEEDEVKLEYSAQSDQKTVVNLTNHTYFNLNGTGSVNEHHLQIPAAEFLETDPRNVPTGKLLKSAGTLYDFQKLRKIGGVPLDTVFSLKGSSQVIELHGDQSGISMQVKTNQPAVVVYVPQELPQAWDYSTSIGLERAAICLETQKFPDAPHQKDFPSVLLQPREKYLNITSWKFKNGL
ncbi:aldose epimerase family protein [Salinimicrobium sp. HB62]|uniref:aldose epimerase family protein n=1 Tax=Salinimicrobium sp. HB62 TaxID=3077781 RepID=UPI002D79073F|nr:aldose epimerase family protein [Salinimicrobium sp. HB62]